MANVFAFNGYVPVIHASSFVHPNATVTGNVVIGRDVYVGPGAAIRADWGAIEIRAGCNVQENCTIHVFPGATMVLEEGAHIGHGAVIHGANIGRNVLVGMNAVVMDNAQVGPNSIIGALTFVPGETVVPERTVFAGNPGKVIKPVSDEMLAWKTAGTRLYQQLPAECHATLRPVEPLREVPPDRPLQDPKYATWKQTRGGG
ncbi:MAG: transferase hexapeptide repeat family protein [Gemmatimonadetes bacterium]|nr:transferase hexapeptide repeat family protein [Gemmatimonadota bacterium]